MPDCVFLALLDAPPSSSARIRETPTYHGFVPQAVNHSGRLVGSLPRTGPRLMLTRCKLKATRKSQDRGMMVSSRHWNPITVYHIMYYVCESRSNCLLLSFAADLSGALLVLNPKSAMHMFLVERFDSSSGRFVACHWPRSTR